MCVCVKQGSGTPVKVGHKETRKLPTDWLRALALPPTFTSLGMAQSHTGGGARTVTLDYGRQCAANPQLFLVVPSNVEEGNVTMFLMQR